VPGEFRRLTFHYRELPAALESCGDELVERLSKGSVAGIESKSIEDRFHYEFEIFDASKGETSHAVVPEDDIHSALVDYCLSHQIPMPRESIKSIRLVNGQLCLDVLIGDAEDRQRSMDDFLAKLSHELRTPLNAIFGFSSMIDRGMFGPIDEQYREFAENIHASGEHLLGIISKVTDLPTAEDRAGDPED